MRHALALAQRAWHSGEIPVGAVAVKEGELLAEGWNQPILSHDPSAHAEIVTLRQLGQMQKNYRFPGITLYVTLEPCTMCVGALVHARVERVVYGAAEPKTGAIESAQRLFESGEFNHKPEIVSGVLADECASLMTEFFAGKRASRK